MSAPDRPPEERLALSTCWASHRHDDGYALLSEARELGFRQVELSHGIRVALLPGILQAIEEGLVGVSSVHNFCPLPSGVSHAAPNLFQPTARRRSERSLWRLHSERTIELAARLGSVPVVMHSGSAPFLLPFDERALLPSETDGSETKSERPAISPARAARAQRRLRSAARGALKRLAAAYTELGTFAAERGVVLAAENREGALEMPFDEDWEDFFASLPEGLPVAAWHDTGHAEIQARRGRLEHERLLAATAPKLVGFHLHDVDDEGRDHRVPGTGSVDFAMVKRYLQPQHQVVFEPSPRLTREEIEEGRRYLLDWLGER